MTEHTPSATVRSSPPWLLIVGLSSLSLLWPLTSLVGIDEGAPRAFTIISVIAVTWIFVVGFGGVPRPVLVLTLTGLGYGVVTMATAAVLGSFGAPIWIVLITLVIDMFWGAIAGLIAFAIQRMRKPRA